MSTTTKLLPATSLTGGGPEGNERLTVQTGALLFVLLVALGLTIIRIGQLTWLHLFLGLLLIGPVTLKLASTGYRFVRYYSHDAEYRRKGPPALPLRVLAPLVVCSTVIVFASGIALLLLGPGSREPLMLVHKVSFFVWLAATGVHVLGHLPELRDGLLADRTLRVDVFAAAGATRHTDPAAGAGRGLAGLHLAARKPGEAGRMLFLAAAVAAGLALALILIPEFAPWLHFHGFHHDH
jgi:hypothetical protein